LAPRIVAWSQTAPVLARATRAALDGALPPLLDALAQAGDAEQLTLTLDGRPLAASTTRATSAGGDGGTAHVEVASTGVGRAELAWRSPVAAPDGLPRIVLEHLAAALELSTSLARQARVARCLAAELDVLGVAAMLVGPGGVVVQANASAERVLAEGDALRRVDGRLRASDDADGARLEARLAPLARGEPVGRHEIRLGRGPGRRPVFVAVEDTPPGPPTVVPADPWALVVVDDPDHAPSLSIERLMVLHGLTRAEAKLAANLAVGWSLEEIAERTQKRVGTLRTQLKKVMARTGCYRQAEVVRLLTRPGALLVLARNGQV
jgi:DNA-binding CsgD family transcriptional regulator